MGTSWSYLQAFGTLFDPDDRLVATGYAGGNCGKDPGGVNNPDLESVHDIGPLPRGVYTFGAPVDHTQLGPFAIPLIPDPSNNMYGRSGFYMHGDTETPGCASDGCIVMPPGVRQACWDSPIHQLVVE
jgi:hypothetical protein